jgi:D-alanine-D-alanine ligase
MQAYKLTNCRDYARIDMRISSDNHVYVLEVNPNPDLTEGVSFMESAEKAGFSFSQTLKRIVDMALSRAQPRTS